MMRKLQQVLVGFMIVVILGVPTDAFASEKWVRNDSSGSVTVEVELKNPDTVAVDKFAQFTIYLTTHSGDLTRTNFTDVLKAEVNESDIQVPVTWTWETKSSHHPILSAKVDLRGVHEQVDKLVLKMRDFAGIRERKFEWDVKFSVGQSSANLNSRYFAMVPNAVDGTITVIDGSSLQVVDVVKVGDTASHGIAVSKDGKYVYSGDMAVGKVVIIEAATQVEVAAFDVGESAHGVDISPDGRFVIIAGDKITVLDTETNSIVASITDGLGQSPSHVEFHPNGQYAYLTDPKDDTLTVIDIPDFEIVTTLIVGEGPNESRISPDGQLLYVANWEGNEIAVVDTQSLTVTNRIPAGEGTHGVVVSPDGKQIWTANRKTNDISVLDAESGSLVATVLSGEYTNHLAFSPDGQRVFVTNARANEVIVVDATSLELLGRVKTGQEPHEIDFVPQWNI